MPNAINGSRNTFYSMAIGLLALAKSFTEGFVSVNPGICLLLMTAEAFLLALNPLGKISIVSRKPILTGDHWKSQMQKCLMRICRMICEMSRLLGFEWLSRRETMLLSLRKAMAIGGSGIPGEHCLRRRPSWEASWMLWTRDRIRTIQSLYYGQIMAGIWRRKSTGENSHCGNELHELHSSLQSLQE